MRISPALLLRRAMVGVFAVTPFRPPGGTATADPPVGGQTGTESGKKSGKQAEHLAVGDGFDSPVDRKSDGTFVRLAELTFPAGANGRAGLVAHTGDRGCVGDSLPVSVAGRTTVLGNAAGPLGDVLNSTTGPAASERVPAYANALGYGSGVFEPGTALRRGGDQLAFRLVCQRDAAWAGALFVAVDARQ